MVRGWRTEESGPLVQAVRPVVDRAVLIGAIARHLRAFSPESVASGRASLRAAGTHSWDANDRAFTIPVSTDREELSVRLEICSLEPLSLQSRCTCDPTGGNACSHAYAALYNLYSDLALSDETIEIRPFEPVEGESSAWHSRLERLDRYLDLDAFDPSARRRIPARDQRISWRIEIHSQSPSLDLEVAPFLERRDPTGAWSRGRRVAWPRLAESAEMWSATGDEAIARLLRTRGIQGDADRQTVSAQEPSAFEVLSRLIGHPHVALANDPTRRIEITRGTLALSLRLDESGRLGFVPTLDGRTLSRSGPHRIFPGGVLAIDTERSSLVVAPADPSRSSLLEHLIEERPTFPQEARREVLSRLPAMEAIFPIELPAEIRSKRVAGDRRIYVLLTPLSRGGLSMSVRVRPLPGGASWPPGEGPKEHGRMAKEVWVTAVRRLKTERRVAERAIETLFEKVGEKLPADERGEKLRSGLRAKDSKENSWTWELRDGDVALGVVDTLQRGEIGDVIVEWPEGSEQLIIARGVGPGALRVQAEKKRDLFGLDGFLEIDDARVALRVLLENARSGRRWVEVGADRWAEISEELSRRLATLADATHATSRGIECGPAAIPLVEDSLREAEVERDDAWQRIHRRFETGDGLDLDPPPGLDAQLRPYQEAGFRWMARLAHWGVGACLADDMGLGKTFQTLAILLHRAYEGPSLVIAPTSVVSNWKREAQRFTPDLRVTLYADSARTSSELRSLGPKDLVVASYGLARRDIEKLNRVEWGTVVLDEAQHIKNARSQTSQALRTLQSRWRLALTGTPIENHLGELWSLFRFLSPGLFGSWESFKRDYAEPIERDGDTSRRSALARVTRPFILRRTKSEVLTELPPRTDVLLTATLSTAERTLYEESRLAALAYLTQKDVKRHKDVRIEVLSALTRLRQLACHPQMVHPELAIASSKTAVFLETVETLRAEGHRALVFSQFTRHLSILRKELDARGISYQYLDGQTPAKERARRVDRFQAGEGDLFLISLLAGGTGLNLTGADYVIHMDPWWNPAVEDQATDRAHRMGQKRPVTVYRIVSEGTIEEEIQALQADKRELMRSLLDGNDVAAKLSTQELVGLLRAPPPDLEVEPEEEAA